MVDLSSSVCGVLVCMFIFPELMAIIVASFRVTIQIENKFSIKPLLDRASCSHVLTVLNWPERYNGRSQVTHFAMQCPLAENASLALPRAIIDCSDEIEQNIK